MGDTAPLPVIDVSGLGPSDGGIGAASAVPRIADAIRAACTGPGFFYVSGHGVPEAVIGAAAAAALAFFRQPPEVKARVRADARHRGWHAMGGALMEGARHADRKEFFSIGLELPEDDPAVRAGEPLRGPNQWPDSVPALRPAMAAYYDAMIGLGGRLLRAVAVSLGLEEGFFAPHYGKPLQRTQAIFYPPQPEEAGAEEEVFGVAPHTDFGCVTLLWQDGNGGLQVRDPRGGGWIDAPPVPGTFVVNVGDLLARWSNDRFASTPHRVVNRSGRERISIATFHDPSFGAVIDPRALGTPEAEARYAPIAAGRHILDRFDKAFGYRKAPGTTAG